MLCFCSSSPSVHGLAGRLHLQSSSSCKLGTTSILAVREAGNFSLRLFGWELFMSLGLDHSVLRIGFSSECNSRHTTSSTWQRWNVWQESDEKMATENRWQNIASLALFFLSQSLQLFKAAAGLAIKGRTSMLGGKMSSGRIKHLGKVKRSSNWGSS